MQAWPLLVLNINLIRWNSILRHCLQCSSRRPLGAGLNNSKPGRDSAVIPEKQQLLVAPAWTSRITPSQSHAAVITASLASIISSRVIWPTEEAFHQNAA